MMLKLGGRALRAIEEAVGFLKGVLAFPASLLASATSLAKQEVAARLPRRTGELARSLGYEQHGSTSIVGLRAKHARYLEFGTRPHEIEPRRARALAFWLRGRLIFARRVLHPGIRPIGFMREAHKALLSSLGHIAREVWELVGEGAR